MKYFIPFFTLLALLSLSACGYKEGVTTGASKAYLYFTGDTSSVEVSIDKGERFSVKPSRDNQYLIKPGKHLIEVYKDDTLVIKREIYVGDGIAKEIEVR